LRGSHVGSFEAAHRLRDGSPFDMSRAPLAERHDLVVVGAGISGLAAAYFYRQRRPNARVLILDTNDDFGGHAKRNEFVVDGQTLLGYGGTQSIDGPAHKWDGVAKGLLKDLGIDVSRFNKAFDQDFYARWNLRQSVFFKKEVFGVDRLVRRPFGHWQELAQPAAGTPPLRSSQCRSPLASRRCSAHRRRCVD
jgi:spermidine dehydrogenase